MDRFVWAPASFGVLSHRLNSTTCEQKGVTQAITLILRQPLALLVNAKPQSEKRKPSTLYVFGVDQTSLVGDQTLASRTRGNTLTIRSWGRCGLKPINAMHIIPLEGVAIYCGVLLMFTTTDTL